MPEPRARSIAAWCRLRGVSRASFYAWEQRDPALVPVTITMGRRRLISDEADAEWHAQRMKAAVRDQRVRRLMHEALTREEDCATRKR